MRVYSIYYRFDYLCLRLSVVSIIGHIFVLDGPFLILQKMQEFRCVQECILYCGFTMNPYKTVQAH